MKTGLIIIILIVVILLFMAAGWYVMNKIDAVSYTHLTLPTILLV